MLAAAAAAHLRRIVLYSVNWPNSDDFDLFLRFLNVWRDHAGLFDKLTLIFERHNEHPVVLNRLAALLLDLTPVGVNFVALIIIGNLALPVAALLFVRLLPGPRSGRDAGVAFALAALLFSPAFYEAEVWATAAIPNLWVFSAAMAAIVAGSTPSLPAAVLALMLAAACALIQANGIFAFAGLMFLWLLNRRFASAAAAAAALTAGLAVLHGATIERLLFADAGSASTPAAGVSGYLTYMLYFLGGAATEVQPWLAGAAGAAVAAACGWIIFAGSQRAPALSAFAVFILLTAAANAIGRASMGLSLAFTTSRYAYVSLLAAAVSGAGLWVLVLRTRARAMPALLIAAVGGYLIWAHSYFDSQFVLRRELLLDSAFTWQKFGDGLAHPSPAHAGLILAESINKGVFFPGEEFSRTPAPAREVALPKAREEKSAVVSLEQVIADDALLWVRGWAFYREASDVCLPQALVIFGERSRTAFALQRRERPDVGLHHKDRRLDGSGFAVLIGRSSVGEEPQRIGILLGSCSRPRLALAPTPLVR